MMDDAEQYIVFDVRQEITEFTNSIKKRSHIKVDFLGMLDDMVDRLSYRNSAVLQNAVRYATLQVASTGYIDDVDTLYMSYIKLFVALRERFHSWLTDSEMYIRLEDYDPITMEMVVEIWRSN